MQKIKEFIGRNPPLVIALFYNLVLLVTLLPLAFLDPRLVTGQPVWIKPIKFAISLALYSATLMWMLTYLKRPGLARKVSWVVAITGMLEMIGIIFQAARGVRSHFNLDTELDARIFSIMGAAITIFWIAHVVTAVALIRDRSASGPVISGIKWGMVVAAFGMVIAFTMTAPGLDGPVRMSSFGQPVPTGHAIGAPQDGPGLTFLGWSLIGGDLRISHFVGLHAMQLVPLFSILALRLRHSASAQIIAIQAFAISYATIVLVLFVQALRGIPFHRIDSLTGIGYALAFVIFASGLTLSLNVKTAEVLAKS